MKKTTDMQYRTARPGDIDAMSRIRLAVTENVLSDPGKVTPQMYLDYMDALGQAWVCEADGKVVGFCYAVREDASIWALFIDQAYEGLGIATRLLEMACMWLLEIGHTNATLSTSAGTRADRFYSARGWERSGPDRKQDVCFIKTLA